MPPEYHKHLFDVLDAGRRIQTYAASMDADRFYADPMRRDAIERQFIVIGEALQRCRKAAPEIFARIDEAEQIIGFRHVLAHGYDVVDPTVVWHIVQGKLPHLLMQVERLLSP